MLTSVVGRSSSRRSVVVMCATERLPSNQGYQRAVVSKLLKLAVERAKRVCQRTDDPHSCAVAWDLVEDYETSLRRLQRIMDDPMESYCRAYPSDPECKVYDV
jgi:esterase/lipase